MDDYSRRQLTTKALGQYQATLAEYFVMCAVGSGILVSPDELPKTSASLAEGDRRGSFSIQEYHRAVSHCLQKKWLQVLTEQKCQEDYFFWQSRTEPTLIDSPLFLGKVDFTKVGYLTYRSIVGEIYGQSHLDYHDSGWVIDYKKQEILVLATNEQMCNRRLTEITQKHSFFTDREFTIVNISPLEKIGSWYPNRFIVSPSGYQCKINYRLNTASND